MDKKKKKLSFIKSAKEYTFISSFGTSKVGKKDTDRTIYLFNCVLPFLLWQWLQIRARIPSQYRLKIRARYPSQYRLKIQAVRLAFPIRIG